MCNPIALMAVSTGISVLGGLQQAGAASAAAKFNAQVNEQNAQLAERRARDALERGQLEEERAKRESTLQREAQQASFSAANLDFGFGSPLDVLIATTTAGELNAATVRSNAEREAEDFEVQAVNSRNNAQLDRFEAKQARTAGLINAAGTAVSGGVGILKFKAGLAA